MKIRTQKLTKNKKINHNSLKEKITYLFYLGLLTTTIFANNYKSTYENNIQKNKKTTISKVSSINESPNITNIIVFYKPDDNVFNNFDNTCKELEKEYEKKTGLKTHLELFSLPTNIKVYSKEKAIELEKSLDSWINKNLTLFAIKNGKIDKAIIGLHSEPDKSYLTDIILSYKKENKELKDSIINATIKKEELDSIAKTNSFAKEIFEKDAQTIYFGCSAGRGENSIAEIFSKDYNVRTEAPTSIYFGKITCDDKGNFKLTSRNNKINKNNAKIFIDKIGNKYLSQKNSEYLLDLTNNKLTSLIELYQKKIISIKDDDEFREIDRTKSFEEKMNYLGLKKIDQGSIDDYMITRTFDKNKIKK